MGTAGYVQGHSEGKVHATSVSDNSCDLKAARNRAETRRVGCSNVTGLVLHPSSYFLYQEARLVRLRA